MNPTIHISITTTHTHTHKQQQQSQMQISTLFSLFLLSFSLFSSTVQGFEPSPAPESFTRSPSVQFSPMSTPGSSAPMLNSLDDMGSPVSETSPPSPALKEAPEPVPEPVPVTAERDGGGPARAQEKEKVENEDESFGGIVPSDSPPEEAEVEMVRWCVVRDEYEDCQYLVSLLEEPGGYTWICVKKDTTQECLESIKTGEADLINLEAGLAYTAFLNYSMKAIANEVYCDHAKSYDAVAIVNRKVCKDNERISLKDFQGHKSCHGGFSTATGWNYPINLIKESFDYKNMNDQEIATSFFSDVCAPSEFEGVGLCSACGNENGSCHSNSLYFGHSGAFRCLVEELGDIAFVKGDTALLYSIEGSRNQSWSTKSLRDFMYLCPGGGCREINGYPGPCSIGTVPANVIMSSNSIPNKKRLLILQLLTNATWTDALYAGKNGASNLLSPSTQELAVIKKLTRSYLGKSASISQSIEEWNNRNPQAIPSTVNSVSDVSSSSSRVHNTLVITFILALTGHVLTVFTPNCREDAS